MGKSFYAIEQQKIKAIIKEPLLELILKFLPHLQPNSTLKNDTWEIIAIKLNNTRFKDLILSNNETSIDDADSLPELNGLYLSKYYEELFSDFKKALSFKLRFRPPEASHVSNHPFQVDFWMWDNRSEAILAELVKLQYADIEIIARISQERLEEIYRKDFNSLNTLNFNNGDLELTDNQDVNEELFDSKEMLNKYKDSALIDKNKVLQEQIQRRDKKMIQISEENKKLLELNHELIEQMKR